MTALTSGAANWKLRYSASGSVQIQTVRNLARAPRARLLRACARSRAQRAAPACLPCAHWVAGRRASSDSGGGRRAARRSGRQHGWAGCPARGAHREVCRV
jgi:chloramphenicol 3-O-phosphotransferase